MILIGLPGSGKTTVGKALAKERGLLFVDSDHVIEQRLGCSIREFFELSGEAAFRDLEQSVIAELCQGSASMVLATGGGAVLRPENRAAMRAAGQVIYLRALPDDLARRLARDTTRPLLQGVDPRVRLRELFAVRDPLYRETASFALETARKSVPALVHLASMQLDMAPGAVPVPPSDAT